MQFLVWRTILSCKTWRVEMRSGCFKAIFSLHLYKIFKRILTLCASGLILALFVLVEMEEEMFYLCNLLLFLYVIRMFGTTILFILCWPLRIIRQLLLSIFYIFLMSILKNVIVFQRIIFLTIQWIFYS
jgi:hypothetical protein